MTDDDSNMLTTSFLDVITCGLGSILLLFFLMVAVKGEMQFDDGSQAELTHPERIQPPLIVIVTGHDGHPIWRGERQPRDAGFDHEWLTWVTGADHAILYARESPPRGWTMKVGPFDPNTRLSVQVIAEGQRVLQVTNAEMKSVTWREGDYLPLWPLPEIATP